MLHDLLFDYKSPSSLESASGKLLATAQSGLDVCDGLNSRFKLLLGIP